MHVDAPLSGLDNEIETYLFRKLLREMALNFLC